MVEDYIARIRAQMLRVLEGQRIRRSGPRFAATHSMRVRLGFIRNALTEMGPRYMTGYGKVPESAVGELNGLVAELNALVDKLDGYLALGLGQDLAARLNRLERSGGEATILAKIERIITEHGLVEFRPPLAMILDRLESERFEIAVFGRVNSQKVYRVLERLAEELAEALQEAAKALNLSEPLQEEDLVSLLREMPQLDVGSLKAPLTRSRFVRVATPLVRARVESKLQDAFGQALSETLQSYGRSLETWLRTAVAQMQARFDSHADTYRAQLDSLIGSSAVTPEAVSAIRYDLAELEGT